MFAAWLKEPALQYAPAFAVIVLAVLVAVTLLRLALSKLLRAIGLGPLDRFLRRAVFGIARGLVVVLCVLIGGLTPLPKQVVVASGLAGATAGNRGAGGQTLAAAGGGEAHSL
jgi:membrane protein required for colicin V production